MAPKVKTPKRREPGGYFGPKPFSDDIPYMKWKKYSKPPTRWLFGSFFSTFSETAIGQTSPPHLFTLVVWILFDNLFQPGWDFCSSKKL
jgi:hypothetical protein